MNSIKGFISLPVLANNLPGQVGMFGELSTVSATFSRNKSNYASPLAYPGVELVGFTTKSAVGSQITLTGTVSNHILAVAFWVYSQYNASTIPANANKSAFIASLVAEFPAMTGVTINEILNGTVSQRMPDYISWTFNDGATDNAIKVWFSDARFQSQYDDYELIVIPPLTTIDQLNASTAVVANLLHAVLPSVVINKIATAAAGVPYSRLVSQSVIWNDPTLPNSTLNTEWTVLVYGLAGNDADKIKAKIREYIADNSLLTVWPTLYPSLYAENEFTIIPLWSNTAVPADALDVALYTPTARVGTLQAIATAHLPQSYGSAVLLPTYLNAQLTCSSAFWRSLSFLAVGNPSNIGSQYSFKTKYPDYMNIDTSSPDWGRMTLTTRDFIIALNAALEQALTVTEIGPVPVGYTRVVRNSKVYLSFSYGGFNYLVLTANSYTVI